MLQLKFLRYHSPLTSLLLSFHMACFHRCYYKWLPGTGHRVVYPDGELVSVGDEVVSTGTPGKWPQAGTKGKVTGVRGALPPDLAKKHWGQDMRSEGAEPVEILFEQPNGTPYPRPYNGNGVAPRQVLTIDHYQEAKLIKGFQTKLPCPLWLLDIPSAVIVPFANYIPSARYPQTNPLWSTPPDSVNRGTKLVYHWDEAIRGADFKLACAFGSYFLYAKVQPWEGQDSYINVWSGKSLARGTMFCSLHSTPNCEHKCLCGDCESDWLDRGWICQCMCWV